MRNTSIHYENINGSAPSANAFHSIFMSEVGNNHFSTHTARTHSMCNTI
jgi:hypothetical protein